jgi:DNA-binding CsgD family transcriptional regulator
MDASLSLVSFNAEALETLAYPKKLEDLREPKKFLATRIREILQSQEPGRSTPFVSEFCSGRRRYFCRTFHADLSAQDGCQHLAIVLERGPSELIPLARISQQFSLTPREQETLEYLLQGLSSREIAIRMNVSPNTVKAFLRLIMIKTGVTSRWAIIRKVMMT